MNEFDDFRNSLQNLVKSFENKTQIRIQEDDSSDILKIYGQNITALSKAKSGLLEIEELAYTVAEHHPYWNLLYQTSMIMRIILENWDGNFTKKDIDEINWSINKLSSTIKKVSND